MKHLTLIALVLLAGCGVEEIKLSDGTRCVTYTNVYAGGIDCDWTQPPVEARPSKPDYYIVDPAKNTIIDPYRETP